MRSHRLDGDVIYDNGSQAGTVSATQLHLIQVYFFSVAFFKFPLHAESW